MIPSYQQHAPLSRLICVQGRSALQRAVNNKSEEIITMLLRNVYNDDMNQAMLAEQVKHQLQYWKLSVAFQTWVCLQGMMFMRHVTSLLFSIFYMEILLRDHAKKWFAA